MGPKIDTGMCFAIEPMINMGSKEVYTKEDGWTICTKDGLYQEFKMDSQLLDKYENLWFERVERFENLKKQGSLVLGKFNLLSHYFPSTVSSESSTSSFSSS